MEIIDIQNECVSKAAPLVADFRVALKSYKGIRLFPT